MTADHLNPFQWRILPLRQTAPVNHRADAVASWQPRRLTTSQVVVLLLTESERSGEVM